ncbi:type II toxin-antitoxin system RelE/ParE family toxin [Ralstonia pickettii]|uniref:type II toxin-antitoxin system RelE/ParE family toxin n=1 Tax=Ralstonia pickettii TaxID=329 RepID=UPI0015FE0FBE|nr:type II toxin-antitoxin system RelE/ParE family toxin [Ralstonia pickettii]MBB0213461.1 type II toxin-antitoxin system RelE/ParE family toxin [Ralstonia pickettii]MBX4144743.1 type II toxin-antitoxin system RelE/ParE family toxin [Ralstonia pickettii]
MIVEWRAQAREDRSNIFDYIADDNPDRIAQQTDALPEHPELYRVGRMRGTREMVLAPNYVLVYRVLTRAGIIEIVRIVGARQDYGRRAKA